MRKRWRNVLGLMLVFVLALAFSACGDDEGEQTGPIEDPGTAPDRFNGIEIVYMAPAGLQDFAKQKALEWHDATGGTVVVEEISFSDIVDKVLASMRTGAYVADIVNIGSQFGGDFMGGGYVVEIPQWALDRSAFSDMLPVYQDLQMFWGGKPYALPWDADLLTYYYRADAFEAASADYQAQYGEPLGPADTWQEYNQIAEFFTGRDVNGIKYGTAELMARDNHGDSGFLTRAAAYAKAPDDPAFFFELDDMTARINNPGFVRALEEWAQVLPYGAPEMLNFDWLENATSFLGGDSAQNIQWGDIGPMSKGELSVISGKIGYAMAPGVLEYWDSQAGEWVTVTEPNRAPFLGFGGWINIIPKTSPNPAAALDFAAYIGSVDSLRQAVVTGGSGANPGANSTLDPALWTEAMGSAEEAAAYLAMIKDSLAHPNAVFDLRIPGTTEYKAALEIAITEALTGQKTAQEALDACAAEWERITDRLGRETQAELYRGSLGQ